MNEINEEVREFIKKKITDKLRVQLREIKSEIILPRDQVAMRALHWAMDIALHVNLNHHKIDDKETIHQEIKRIGCLLEDFIMYIQDRYLSPIQADENINYLVKNILREKIEDEDEDEDEDEGE